MSGAIDTDVTLGGTVNTNLNGSVSTKLDGNVETKLDGKMALGGLDNIHVSIEKLPKIQVGLDPLTVNLNVALAQVPQIRMHMPAHFQIGLSLAGFDLFCLKLCGEAMMIMEPFERNPAETCGRIGRLPPPSQPPPTPVPGAVGVVTRGAE